MKLAALGYYGFSNLGDEAVLAGIRAALATEARFDGAEFLVLSNDPAETTRLHAGVSATNRWAWRGAWDALAGTDLFILGGGSLLQDATSVKSVLWYFLMASLARRRSKKVLWWGQGIGPLASPTSQKLVRILAARADALTVRDEKSADLLKRIGARGSIETVADPAFALTPSKASGDDRGGTVLAPRPWKDCEPDWSLPERAPLPFVRLPMHLPGDREALGGSAAGLYDWKERGASVTDVLGRVAAAELVVAMRLHALIFAARVATPFVAVSYDPKVDALAEAAGQTDARIPVSQLTRKSLADAVERVLDTAPARRETLKSFAQTQSALALRPAKIASELFG